MLGRIVGFIEVPVATQNLIEVDLLAIGKHGPPTDGGGTVHAGKRARRCFGKRTRCPAEHADRIGVLIIGRDHDSRSVRTPARQNIDGSICAVALFGDAVTPADSDTLEIRTGNHVHDARHCVRTIDCGGAILEHLGASQHVDRYHVEVGRGIGTRPASDQASSIEQHQRALDAQTTQVDLSGAVAIAGPVGRGLIAGEARIGGKPLQKRLDIHDAGVFHFFHANDGRRPNTFDIRTANSRSGYEDSIGCIRLGGYVRAARFGRGFVRGILRRDRARDRHREHTGSD